MRQLLVGSSFEVDTEGYLIGKSNEEVLMSFQEAVDLGVPLVDYGGGHSLFCRPKPVERFAWIIDVALATGALA